MELLQRTKSPGVFKAERKGQRVFLCYEVHSLLLALVLELQGKINLRCRQLSGGHDKLQKKSTKPELFVGTHRGGELQLRPLSVALLEELAGHQLSNLESVERGAQRLWPANCAKCLMC